MYKNYCKEREMIMIFLIDIPQPIAIEIECPKCKTKMRINAPVPEFFLCPKKKCKSAIRIRYSFLAYINKPALYEKKVLEGDKKFRKIYKKYDKKKALVKGKYKKLLKELKIKGVPI